MFSNADVLLSAVDREPDSIAIIDGDKCFKYRDLFKLATLIGSKFKSIGLEKGDSIVTLLQNNWQFCLLYWACQLYGIIIVPLNWRISSKDLDYYIKDSQTKHVVFQAISAEAIFSSSLSNNIYKISLDNDQNVELSFKDLININNLDINTYVKDPSMTSIMLYTSGTTGIGKGVPRSHMAEKSASLAHILQNKYEYKEITLGVMPLYHTMGIRLLICMCLLNGLFICQNKFDPVEALNIIYKWKVSSLYLVPTLFHDLLN